MHLKYIPSLDRHLCFSPGVGDFSDNFSNLVSTMAQITAVLSKVYEEYESKTPKRIKIIDAYLAYILLTGIIEFVYCCLVGTFPFNSFLAGFISTVASFVLAVCLRLQVNPANKVEFAGISVERAFADFIFAHIILHLVVVNFIG